MISKKKLLEELEQLPFIKGRYDKVHANPSFIAGCESMYELIVDRIKEFEEEVEE